MLMCMYLCSQHVFMSTLKPEEPPETGVTVDYKPPKASAESWTRVLCEEQQVILITEVSPTPGILLFLCFLCLLKFFSSFSLNFPNNILPH